MWTVRHDNSLLSSSAARGVVDQLRMGAFFRAPGRGRRAYKRKTAERVATVLGHTITYSTASQFLLELGRVGVIDIIEVGEE